MDRSSKGILILAALLGTVGAFVALVINDDAIDTQAAGGIVLAFAFVLVGIAAITATTGSTTNGSTETKINIENLRAVTGLVAVVVGILAVAALSIVAVELLDDGKSTVAVTTSAFGIVSTLITAYLGIKATANTSQKVAAAASQRTEEATIARYEADIEHGKADRLKQEIDKIVEKGGVPTHIAQDLKQAKVNAETEAENKRNKASK